MYREQKALMLTDSKNDLLLEKEERMRAILEENPHTHHKQLRQILGLTSSQVAHLRKTIEYEKNVPYKPDCSVHKKDDIERVSSYILSHLQQLDYLKDINSAAEKMSDFVNIPQDDLAAIIRESKIDTDVRTIKSISEKLYNLPFDLTSRVYHAYKSKNFIGEDGRLNVRALSRQTGATIMQVDSIIKLIV
ncbi:MAG: hypothetical protein V1839_02705 [archaeon]